MKLITYISICILTALFVGCGGITGIFTDRAEVSLRDDMENANIAILTFTRSGRYLPADAGRRASDRLSETLFIRGRYTVIDRSQVNQVFGYLGIASPEAISPRELENLGRVLNVQYIVAGRIYQEAPVEFMRQDAGRELSLNVRIVSVENGEVVGVARHSIRYRDSFDEALDRLVSKIARGLSR